MRAPISSTETAFSSTNNDSVEVISASDLTFRSIPPRREGGSEALIYFTESSLSDENAHSVE